MICSLFIMNNNKYCSLFISTPSFLKHCTLKALPAHQVLVYRRLANVYIMHRLVQYITVSRTWQESLNIFLILFLQTVNILPFPFQSQKVSATSIFIRDGSSVSQQVQKGLIIWILFLPMIQEPSIILR